LKTENDTFKSEKAKSEGLSLRKEAAKALGYNEDAFARLAANLEIVKDGDKFKVGDTVLTKDFIEKHEDFAPFVGSLNTKSKITPFPSKEEETTVSLADKIREGEKKRSEQAQTRTVDEAFGRGTVAQI